MIKLTYKPWEPERAWGFAEDLPPVEELTMTLSDGISWEEATTEFHNFLRGAGYVIPYNLEWHLDYSDPPDREKKSAQELLKECIDRGIECAMETPAEDCRVPFDIGTEIQFDIWDEIRSAFYFEYESVIKKNIHMKRC